MGKKVVKIKRKDGITQGYHVGSITPPTSMQPPITYTNPEEQLKKVYEDYNKEQKIIDMMHYNEPPIVEGGFQYHVVFEPDSPTNEGWNRKHSEDGTPKGWKIMLGERGKVQTRLNMPYYQTREQAVTAIATEMKEQRLKQKLNQEQLPLYNPEYENAQAVPLLEAPEGPWTVKLVYDELFPTDSEKTIPGYHEGWNLVAYSPNWEGREMKDPRRSTSHKGCVYISKQKGYATREEAVQVRDQILEQMENYRDQPRKKLNSQSYMFEPQPWLGQDRWNDPTEYGTE